MPFARDTLTTLRSKVASYIQGALAGADPLLRFANLKIMGEVQAGAWHEQNGYLDYIAINAVPFTAEQEYLEGWAGLKNVVRKSAQAATGAVMITGTPATLIPSGSQLIRGDGYLYQTTADVTIAGGGTIAAPAIAVLKSDGSVSGAAGDADVSTILTFISPIAGVQANATVSTAFEGGDDPEGDDGLRTRMLQVYQQPPQGGAKSDYEIWSLQVAGVTRAWCLRNYVGTGTVVVFVMLDQAESAHGGFPQGVSGVATGETRGSPVATGDQLTVANYLFARQPVTALVYVSAPAANPVNFTINGLSGAGSTVQNAVKAAIDDVFLRDGGVSATSSTVFLADIQAAIETVPGTSGFVITSPVANIVSGAGQLPTRGVVTFT